MFKNIKKKDNKKTFNFLAINKRNFGIDLLRIFAMINVINLHILIFSGLLSSQKNPVNKEAWFLEAFSFFAVDTFGLISGYVGFNRHKFSNLIYFWFKVFFYSIGISLYLYFLYPNQIRKKDVFIHQFPLLINRDWYVNAYFSMYLFLPFINFGINFINKKLHRNLMVCFVLYFSFYNVFARMYGNRGYNFLNNGFSFGWLLILYIIGSYYGKYYKEKKLGIINFIFYFVVYFCSSYFSFYFEYSKKNTNLGSAIFLDYLSPTMVFQSLSLLNIFSRIDIKNKYLIKIISFLTPLNFSVYIIHLRFFKTSVKLRVKLFDIAHKIRDHHLFFKYYGLSIIVYFFCILIDYIRALIFKFLRLKNFALFLDKKFPEFYDKLICSK